jgi:hypothetical protein
MENRGEIKAGRLIRKVSISFIGIIKLRIREIILIIAWEAGVRKRRGGEAAVRDSGIREAGVRGTSIREDT